MSYTLEGHIIPKHIGTHYEGSLKWFYFSIGDGDIVSVCARDKHEALFLLPSAIEYSCS